MQAWLKFFKASGGRQNGEGRVELRNESSEELSLTLGWSSECDERAKLSESRQLELVACRTIYGDYQSAFLLQTEAERKEKVLTTGLAGKRDERRVTSRRNHFARRTTTEVGEKIVGESRCDSRWFNIRRQSRIERKLSASRSCPITSSLSRPQSF